MSTSQPEKPPRQFGPLCADHPAVGSWCPGCHLPIAAGDYILLVFLNPKDDLATTQRRSEPDLTPRAVVVHWDCRDWRPQADTP